MKAELSFILALFFLFLFSLWSYAVFHVVPIDTLDQDVYALISQWTNPGWIRLNRVITYLGNGAFLFSFVSVLLIYLFVKGRVGVGLWYFFSSLIGFELSAALKVFFGRMRPESLDPSYVLKSLAYPSGHAFGALIFYLLTSWVLYRLWPHFLRKKVFYPLVVIVIGCVGVTRITLGVHWMSDVIGGYLLGIFWVFLSLAIVKWLKLFADRV